MQQSQSSKGTDSQAMTGNADPEAQRVTANKQLFQEFYDCAGAVKKLLLLDFPSLEHDLEDIIQEAIIKLWESRKDWEDTPFPKRVLLRITARNLAIDELRKRAVRPALHDVEIDDDQDTDALVYSEEEEEPAVRENKHVLVDYYTPEDSFKNQELILLYASKVEALGAVPYRAFTMRYQDGMSNKEISEVLNLPVGTVGRILAEVEAYVKEIKRHWKENE